MADRIIVMDGGRVRVGPTRTGRPDDLYAELATTQSAQAVV
jgi:hypothetical protein